jgi:hypothetical protein
MKRLLVELARRSLDIGRRGLCGEPPNFSHPAVAHFLSPATALALDGDKAALGFFCRRLLRLARDEWGLHQFACGSGLNDAFCIRSFTECYKLLLRAGLLSADVMTGEERLRVEEWLFRLALLRAGGSIAGVPEFETWHNRNQCVPATMVYEIADLIARSALTSHLDTAPLWRWADANMVGWDLNWRSPDDAWLYQFIWTWSAYRHAALRRPELLRGENARRSFEFYKMLWAPGGRDLVFGESNAGDLLAAATSLTLGAHLFQDGEQKWLAGQFLKRAQERGDDQNLAQRGPELHRLYSLWPAELAAVSPARHSMLLESPLAGRGWALGGTPYNQEIKSSDQRFPDCGLNDYDYDPIYQEREASLYEKPKPDKLIFCEDAGDNALFALADLRAQGLHDHPDVPGVSTLIGDGVPWLVESAYLPRGFNRQRWLHNVPLYRRGHVAPEELRTYRSDTWREVASGDVWLEHRKGVVIAQARIPHDAFDYLDWDGNLFDIERTFLFDPRGLFIVVDRLTAAENGAATVAQAWHTPAQVEMAGQAARFSRAGKTWCAAFAGSTPLRCELTEHEPPQRDDYYFPGPVRDLLWHTKIELQKGGVLTMAAAFAREPVTLAVNTEESGVQCNGTKITLGDFADVRIERLTPAGISIY